MDSIKSSKVVSIQSKKIMSNPTIKEVKLQRVIDRQKYVIDRLIEMFTSERDTEREAWDIVVESCNNTSFPLEIDFHDERCQELHEKYLKDFSSSDEKQEEMEKLAVQFLDAVCRAYINDQHGECIKIERTSEFQR